MKLTKHEAAILETALNYSKYEIVADYFGEKTERIKAIKKLEILQGKLIKHQIDKRLQSKSGRSYQYPTLSKIILNKLK